MLIDTREAERRLNRRALLAVIAGFLLLVLAFVATVLAFRYNEAGDARVVETYEVLDELTEAELGLERVETASRGYLLSPEPHRIETYRQNKALIGPALDRTDRLVAADPAQQRSLDRIRVLVREELTISDALMGLAMEGRLDEAQARFAETVKARRVVRMRALAREMRGRELALLKVRSDAERQTTMIAESVMALTFLVIVLMTVGTIRVARGFIAQLSRSRDELYRLNSGLERIVADRTADLTRANDEIQRFAYIVSHDLRSPLVNVMGFTAELERAAGVIATRVRAIAAAQPTLVDEETRLAVDEDLPEAIGFIRSSTQKMDRLINAILALSRQGRRVLSPEPLDLAALVGEAIVQTSAQADAKGASVAIEGALPTIHHDRVAIEQLVGNLLDNALKYLDPARPGVIRIRGEETDGRVRLHVADNGRGIDPRDHERIFELFRRSGPQDQRGEGIGLAHVRALAYRLGGTITVDSSLGAGSTFTIDLPVRLAGDGEMS